MIKVGIPRGLLYYKYGALWKSFLEGLGAEVVISPMTNKRMFLRGTKHAETELCAPVKVYYGHAMDLLGKVDRLAIPRMVSLEKKEYTCPKFMGLPDLIAAIGPDFPPIDMPVFDHSKGKREHYRTIFKWGEDYGKTKLQTIRAWRKALKAQSKFEKLLHEGYLPDEIIRGELSDTGLAAQKPFTIAVVGHPYNIYDNYISLNIVEKIRGKGIRVLTPEVLTHKQLDKALKTLPKKLFWTYEKEIYGAANHWFKNGGVDGIIYVLSFACGPDSLIKLLIEKEAKKYPNIPLMSVVIDEHSAEAGLVTRIEAFTDMIEFKRNKDLAGRTMISVADPGGLIDVVSGEAASRSAAAPTVAESKQKMKMGAGS